MRVNRDNVERFVNLRHDGAIAIESILDRSAAWVINREIILKLVENNIHQGVQEDGERPEYIDWDTVWSEYDKREEADGRLKPARALVEALQAVAAAKAIGKGGE